MYGTIPVENREDRECQDEEAELCVTMVTLEPKWVSGNQVWASGVESLLLAKLLFLKGYLVGQYLHGGNNLSQRSGRAYTRN